MDVKSEVEDMLQQLKEARGIDDRLKDLSLRLLISFGYLLLGLSYDGDAQTMLELSTLISEKARLKIDELDGRNKKEDPIH